MEQKELRKRKWFDHWIFVLILCFTLGLAPFFPVPHLWGKILWIAGGAVGMKVIDWFDFLWHGFPWLLLLRLIFLKGRKISGKESGR